MDTILHRAARTVAILLCASLAAPAMAQVQAQLTASNLRYTLTDLDPRDGQAPEFRVGTEGRGASAEISVRDAQGGLVYEARENPGGSHPDEARISWNDAVRASAMLAPGMLGFWTEGGTFTAQVWPGLDQTRTGSASLSAFEEFRLSPYSAMTVSLDVDILLALARDAAPGQYAHVNATFSGRSNFGHEAGMAQATGGTAYDDGQSLQPGDHRTEVLTLTFTNDTADWGDAAFSFNILAEAQLAPLSPVPEPGGWALLGGGLGILALAELGARRRKKRGAEAPLSIAQARA